MRCGASLAMLLHRWSPLPKGGDQRPPARSRRGQSTAEFALGLPLLMLLSLGVVDIGRAYSFKEAVTNTTRQAARYASQRQTVADFACANFGGTVTRNLPDAGVDKISDLINAAALESSTDGTTSTAVLRNTSNPTQITLTWHCNGAASYTTANATSTDPTAAGSASVRVKIDYTYTLITPVATQIGSPIHLKLDIRQRSECRRPAAAASRPVRRDHRGVRAGRAPDADRDLRPDRLHPRHPGPLQRGRGNRLGAPGGGQRGRQPAPVRGGGQQPPARAPSSPTTPPARAASPTPASRRPRCRSCAPAVWRLTSPSTLRPTPRPARR